MGCLARLQAEEWVDLPEGSPHSRLEKGKEPAGGEVQLGPEGDMGLCDPPPEDTEGQRDLGAVTALAL